MNQFIKMEAENESGNDSENYSRLVSSVIHEYDIIDEEPGARSEESSNEDVKSRGSSQDDIILPRVNCPEKIVRPQLLSSKYFSSIRPQGNSEKIDRSFHKIQNEA